MAETSRKKPRSGRGALRRAAPCTRRGQSDVNVNVKSGLPEGGRGGSGGGRRRKPRSAVRPSRWRLCVRALAKQCFASKAPSPLGAWPRHPCRGHSRHRTHPAFDCFLRAVGNADGVRSVFHWKTDLTPELHSISDRFHPRVAWIYRPSPGNCQGWGGVGGQDRWRHGWRHRAPRDGFTACPARPHRPTQLTENQSRFGI